MLVGTGIAQLLRHASGSRIFSCAELHSPTRFVIADDGSWRMRCFPKNVNFSIECMRCGIALFHSSLLSSQNSIYVCVAYRHTFMHVIGRYRYPSTAVYVCVFPNFFCETNNNEWRLAETPSHVFWGTHKTLLYQVRLTVSCSAGILKLPLVLFSLVRCCINFVLFGHHPNSTLLVNPKN